MVLNGLVYVRFLAQSLAHRHQWPTILLFLLFLLFLLLFFFPPGKWVGQTENRQLKVVCTGRGGGECLPYQTTGFHTALVIVIVWYGPSTDNHLMELNGKPGRRHCRPLRGNMDQSVKKDLEHWLTTWEKWNGIPTSHHTQNQSQMD